MKKRKALIIGSLLMVIVAILIIVKWPFAKIANVSSYEIDEKTSVIIQIDAVHPTNIAYHIINNSEYVVYCNCYAQLQLYKDGEWYALVEKAQEDQGGLYMIESNKSEGMAFYWKKQYGTLLKGQYRLLKAIKSEGQTFWIASTFEIN